MQALIRYTLPAMLVFAAVNIALPATADMSDETRARAEAAAVAEHRSDKNIARNEYRHPVETLAFFGLEHDMTVVELSPGGGWYTEILAAIISDEGQLYAAAPPVGTKYGDYVTKVLESKPDLFADIERTDLSGENMKFAPDGSADMVLTFRNLHSFMDGKDGDLAVYRAAYDALKPGGIFGVVEHRGRTDEPQDPEAGSGYVREDYAIERIESVGFELADKSEINANPKDTKDYTMGVWTLPPTLKLGVFRQEHFKEIGESDRFTLKFRKPAEEEME